MAAKQHIWIFQSGKPSFAFDAVIREQHDRELVVPQEPVDTGYVVSDHAYLQPDHLSIEAAVSDHPLHVSSSDVFAGGKSRSVTAFDLIRGLQGSAEPFSIQTGLLLYDNMLLTSLSAGQEARTSSALLFRAEFTRITITSTKTVTYPVRKKGKPARQGAAKVNKGDQDAPNADYSQRRSVLSSLLGASSGGGIAIGSSNPDLPPGIIQLLGPGSALP